MIKILELLAGSFSVRFSVILNFSTAKVTLLKPLPWPWKQHVSTFENIFWKAVTFSILNCSSARAYLAQFNSSTQKLKRKWSVSPTSELNHFIEAVKKTNETSFFSLISVCNSPYELLLSYIHQNKINCCCYRVLTE